MSEFEQNIRNGERAVFRVGDRSVTFCPDQESPTIYLALPGDVPCTENALKLGLSAGKDPILDALAQGELEKALRELLR